jgi:hypothetical protein
VSGHGVGATPGPWRIGHGLTNDGQRYVMAGPSDEPVRVALIDRRSPYKRGRGYDGDCTERDANARLIAASPALLEAARRAEAVLTIVAPRSHTAEYLETLTELRAALALSRGGPQL